MTTSWQETVLADVSGRGRISDPQIVEMIRQAVLTQRLPPGTRLPEVTLGEIFGVSRSVVRKALTRLASDHVIVQQPNQVARVAAPSVEETREIFAARRLIEGEVAALLAGNLSAEQRHELAALIEREQEAHERGDEASRVECSLAVHRYLADQSPNRVLGAMLADLILRTSIVIALYKRPGMEACYLDHDHADLLTLLESGPAEAARRRMHDHLSELEALLDLRAQEARIDLAAILGGVA
ncbi:MULTISPECIES: GntR family transcriptional regulator [Modicisalibacter]|uniref:GntR family transcriptional regulator n=1 Tax=Modicisalibacter tunisiensis TaxID=390637 RepID=A0ABS7X0B9_9GAMM|nr:MULTISPECIES: GntR family transcriptional regulator [Modicisalibacter]MBZ9538248.1 GntR family transcriptional regulator [Modicisalibacter tunisiensis]MBZ9568340.1 GntR family transcriptional regulator [Modicisalibacter tunisiensis]